MKKYDTSAIDIARQMAIMLDRPTKTIHYRRNKVEQLVVEICRLRAQLRDAEQENSLLWQALRKSKA